MEALYTNTRISLSKILVTTDFSQVSKTALAYATALANQYEAKIVIAHALSPEPPLSLPLVPLPVESDSVRLRAEPKLLDFVLGSSSIGAIPAKVLLPRGEVWNVTSEIIRKNQIDLV